MIQQRYKFVWQLSGPSSPNLKNSKNDARPVSHGIGNTRNTEILM